MFKPLIAGIALALGGAVAAQAAPATPSAAAPMATPAWVAKSNADAQSVLKVLAEFNPEFASQFGLPGYDDKSIDLKPGIEQRSRAAMTAARDSLQKKLAAENDPDVRQDLQIMIKAADRNIEDSKINEQYLLPYIDVGQTVFQGEFTLLQDQVAAARRPSALKRLQCYVGMTPGCTPVTKEAQALFQAKLDNPKLIGPYKVEVEQNLSNTARYVDGIRKLYAKYKIDGAGPALDAMQKQLDDYDAWVKATVLPHARTDFRLPPEVYANNLKQVGLDISPQELIKKAELEFMETQAQMQMMASDVAKAEGMAQGHPVDATDYRDVIKGLKKQQLDRDSIEPYYHQVIGKIEDIIRQQNIVTLPDRKMIMRVASEAESAAEPAPHMDPPPLIGNHGERGSFVLPLGNPPNGKGDNQAYDDFTCKACAWTLTAHEGRPGHELQFSAMVEHGVSLARSLFAFNSVNVEGWALYSEYMMMPYEPKGGQMIALQLRLLRAARAFLDPMLNLGLITHDRAHDILVNDVGLSEAFAREELDRFTFRSPGQATAYFYGYSRLLELRAHTQIELGSNFNLKQFNDFLIAQGLLPPDQLAEAVDTRFIPAHGGKRAQ
ncbi:DUF885 domain-containing protein [Rhodanobacter sp. C03]|uniref:DUF885 domain-containing protein n=1 Tax=Rhodanobacter sp. C03 TaxID=1945858 RepID=UPI00098768EC|nr:DUF885 domain-containing protein [Rhodanobacter sp. C03]OOG58369.1 hypothetical protein B0E48_06165 [Rhodanobacter sp. C03]